MADTSIADGIVSDKADKVKALVEPRHAAVRWHWVGGFMDATAARPMIAVCRTVANQQFGVAVRLLRKEARRERVAFGHRDHAGRGCSFEDVRTASHAAIDDLSD